MSIILDALKKAEEQKASYEQLQNNQSNQSAPVTPNKTFDGSAEANAVPSFGIKSPKKKSPIMLFILIAVALGAGGHLAYKKFLVKDETPEMAVNVPKVKTFTMQNSKKETATEEQNVDQDEVVKLKAQATEKFQDGKYEDSANIYKSLTKLAPLDAEVYNNYGVVLKRLEKLDESKAQYLQALALTGDKYPEALNNLAVLYIGQNNFRDAEEYLVQAVALNPDYVDAYLHLALCQEKVGTNDEAVKNYEKFLNLSYGRFDRKIRLQVENRISRLNGA